MGPREAATRCSFNGAPKSLWFITLQFVVVGLCSVTYQTIGVMGSDFDVFLLRASLVMVGFHLMNIVVSIVKQSENGVRFTNLAIKGVPRLMLVKQ